MTDNESDAQNAKNILDELPKVDVVKNGTAAKTSAAKNAKTKGV